MFGAVPITWFIPVEEGVGWLANYCKLQGRSCFGIFRRSIFRIDLRIRPKGAWNPKNCPKSISRKPLIVESWLTLQNDRKNGFTLGVQRYAYYPSDNQMCPKNTIVGFWGVLWWRNCMIFHMSWTDNRIKLVGPLELLQVWIYYGCSKICIPLTQLEVPRKCLFWGPYMMKVKKFPYHENYISSNWLSFRSNQKTTLSVSV